MVTVYAPQRSWWKGFWTTLNAQAVWGTRGLPLIADIDEIVACARELDAAFEWVDGYPARAARR